MLKKLFVLQMALLTTAILLGFSLTMNNTDTVKMFHGGIGFLAGINAIAVAYLTYKSKASSSVQMLSLVGVILTLLAGFGGKLAATDYSTGLMIMRPSAWLSLIVTGIGFYKLSRQKV